MNLLETVATKKNTLNNLKNNNLKVFCFLNLKLFFPNTKNLGKLLNTH
jgi:hypothetical protein